jgi:hypothetical protein
LPFGRLTRGPPRFSLATAKNQTEALKLLAAQTRRSIVDYEISVAARAIVKEGCSGRARDDECELEAIYNAVKSGTDAVDWLQDGVHYVVDSRDVDQFFAPLRLMEMCKRGACAADCDDQAAMVCALAGSVGFRVGLYAWGQKTADDYEHVLAVAEVPKSPRPGEKPALVALDTTVESAYVGWKPPPGKYLLIWLN